MVVTFTNQGASIKYVHSILELENPSPFVRSSTVCPHGPAILIPPLPLGVDVLDGSPPIKLVLLPLRPISSQQKSLKEIREERAGGSKVLSVVRPKKAPLFPPFTRRHFWHLQRRRRPLEDHNIYSSLSAQQADLSLTCEQRESILHVKYCQYDL